MAIEDLLKNIEKDFNKKFKDNPLDLTTADKYDPVDGIVVDNPLLEYALDRRILAYGRFYLLYGKKGSSKTSLFYEFAKIIQQHKGDVVWIETERAVDREYAAMQGVDLSKVVMPEIETGSLQQALDFSLITLRNMSKAYPDGNTPVMICLDSIAGCVPDYELQDKLLLGETKLGEHARILSNFFRKAVPLLANEKCIFVLINQLKERIGGMSFPGAEEPEAMIGGEGPRFHSTYQFKIARTKDLVFPDEHGAERKVGSRHKITVKRNKLGREGNSQSIEFDLYAKGGVDWYCPLVRKLADEYTSLIGKSGGWYTWKDADTVITHGDKSSSDPDTKWREHELALAIKNSHDAKEKIRHLFGIRELESKEIIEQHEVKRKTKRKRAADAQDEIDDSPLSKA